MQKLSLTGAILVLTAAAFSQASSLPTGFDKTDGASNAFRMGRYPNGVFQIMYGDLFGSNAVASWSRASWRRSTTNTTTNYARSWKKVTVKLGLWNMVTTDVRTQNLIKPAVVYSGPLSFPGHTGTPAKTPASWGTVATKNDLSIGFTQPYLYIGKKNGLTMDMEFTGGTLKNAASWSFVGYYLDGAPAANMSTGGNSTLHPATTTCSENSYFVNWLFTDRLPGGAMQHRTQLYQYGPTSVAKMIHIGAISLSGSATGTKLLQSCHPLHLDLSKPWVPFYYVTDAAGDYFSDFLVTRFVPATVGIPVWTQAAYPGSKGELQLTRAGNAPVAAPATGNVSFTQWLYKGSLGDRLLFGPYNTRNLITYFQ